MQVRSTHATPDIALIGGCAGVLFLLHTCVLMIFWRVFMRISYSCPEHLKFALTIERWTNLVELTGDAIDWLDQNDKLYDVWMLVAYAATSCALVQVGVLVTWEHFSEPFSSVPHVGTTAGPRCRGKTQEVTRLCPAMGKVALTGSHVGTTEGWHHKNFNEMLLVDMPSLRPRKSSHYCTRQRKARQCS
jgi:hypothetical protein